MSGMDVDTPRRAQAERTAGAVGMVEVLHLRLFQPLPCGVGACGAPAHVALAEPDLELPSLWVALPVCEQCWRQRLPAERRLE